MGVTERVKAVQEPQMDLPAISSQSVHSDVDSIKFQTAAAVATVAYIARRVRAHADSDVDLRARQLDFGGCS